MQKIVMFAAIAAGSLALAACGEKKADEAVPEVVETAVAPAADITAAASEDAAAASTDAGSASDSAM